MVLAISSGRLPLALPNTIILLISSFFAWLGEHGVIRLRRPQAIIGFGGALLLGTIFVVVQFVEWHARPFQLGTNSFASLYYITTAFHIGHVIIGLCALAAILLWTVLDYFSPRRQLTVSAGVLYWHFVDVIWLFVFSTYYITPYLGFPK